MSAFDRLQLRLSVGVGIPDAVSIEIAQLRAVASLSGEVGPSPNDQRLRPDLRYSNQPDRWASKFTVGVSTSSFYAGIADEVRGSLGSQGNAIQQAFASWKTLSESEIADQFDFELSSYGPTIVVATLDALGRAASGQDPLAVLNRSVQRFNAVAYLFGGHASVEEGYDDAMKFFLGDRIKLVPQARIAAGMYAVLARQAATGMKKIEASFATDIVIVSSIVPYCDANLVDGRCAEVLRQPPARDEISRWGSTVLSARDRQGVSDWLGSLAAGVTSGQLAAVQRAYGPVPVASFDRAFER